MNTAQAILYSTLIFSVSGDICDKHGICADWLPLKEVLAHDSFDCWKQCLSYDGCNYATFALSNYCTYDLYNNLNCAFYSTCHEFADAPCLTSSRECAHCDFTGLCIVSTNLAPLHLF